MSKLKNHRGEEVKIAFWDKFPLASPPALLTSRQERHLKALIFNAKSLRQAFFLTLKTLRSFFPEPYRRNIVEITGIHSVQVAKALLNRVYNAPVEDFTRVKGEKIEAPEGNITYRWEKDKIYRNGKLLFDLSRDKLSFVSFTLQLNRGGIYTFRIDFYSTEEERITVSIILASYKN